MYNTRMTNRKKDNVQATSNRVRLGRNINVWISDELFEAFDTLRMKNRRTVKAEVEVILEKHLAEHGLWPPPDTEE
jgi:hypothetical protein